MTVENNGSFFSYQLPVSSSFPAVTRSARLCYNQTLALATEAGHR